MLLVSLLILTCPQLPYQMVDPSTMEPIYVNQRGHDLTVVRDSNTLPMSSNTDRWQLATGTIETNIVRMTTGFKSNGKLDQNCTIVWNSSSVWTPLSKTYYKEEEEEEDDYYDSEYYNDFVYSSLAELQAEVSSLHFLYSGIRKFLGM